MYPLPETPEPVPPPPNATARRRGAAYEAASHAERLWGVAFFAGVCFAVAFLAVVCFAVVFFAVVCFDGVCLAVDLVVDLFAEVAAFFVGWAGVAVDLRVAAVVFFAVAVDFLPPVSLGVARDAGG